MVLGVNYCDLSFERGIESPVSASSEDSRGELQGRVEGLFRDIEK
ncbi:MAG: hypothetical protein ACI9S8_002349 [Chlamydiales bacterium]|jgi:hypothetical protein